MITSFPRILKPHAAIRVLMLAVCPLLAAADVFHVDPERGSMDNDGSKEHPWRNIEEVIKGNLIETRIAAEPPLREGGELVVRNEGAPIGPGDTVVLHSGYHGEINIVGGFNREPITIMAAEGESPVLGRIRLSGVAGWVVKGLTVTAEAAPDYRKVLLIEIADDKRHGPSRDVTIEDCVASSVEDVSGWTLEDWNSKPCNGIAVGGDRCTVRRNVVRNINFGIVVGGEDNLVEHNVIENFSGDGIRGLGDRGVFQYNTVRNCYDVNDNHDDGFQSWSRNAEGVGKGVVKGIVLRGNVIINWTDPNQPFRGNLQGIGCFDGFFEDWVVENNVVVVDHWHGITLLGARNCVIRNNTVVDLLKGKPGPPWIEVGAHKDGRPSEGCVVKNNLGADFRISPGNIADHNFKLGSFGRYFVNPGAFDFRLRKGSPAIDAGGDGSLPEGDAAGNPRKVGAAVDAGAYEFATE